ncbi:GGDEF domain-containing protein [Candidatus Latescibacterota bacterium]
MSNFETQRMMDSDMVGLSEVFGLQFLPWALTFTLLSGIVAGFVAHYSHKLSAIRDMKTKKLLYQATHDNLTDLYNREAFVNQLKYQLHQRVGETAIFFIDLDGFKQANDRYGHEAGNIVLKETAERLREILRKSDFICRYGGDEFVIIAGKDESKDYKTVAERILKTISQPYLDEAVNFITCSIGIAISEERETVDTLIKKADFAMYSAKRAGKNMFKFCPVTT